jgi:excinuclease ABC subunit C
MSPPPVSSVASPDLTSRADQLPRSPGVYMFKDLRGKVLYVGKARDIRARVRQYITGQDERLMVRFLVRAAADIDAVVVETEREALVLENTLIKKHRPRYNVKLVDDSSFLHLELDLGARWPRYRLVRRVEKRRGKIRHFGPFTSASRGRSTLEFVQRRFPLRTCSDRELRSRKRPCLMHQMGRCVAPCVDLCTKEEYAEVVEQSLLFLEGRDDELLRRLRGSMDAAAESLEFERAATLRDTIQAIETTLERKSVADTKLGTRDIWGLHRTEAGGAVALLPVRQGMMQEAAILPFTDHPGHDGELLSSVLNTWYADAVDVPVEILVSCELADGDALAELLSERRGAAVRIRVPQRGEKTRLVAMAVENAQSAWDRRVDAASRCSSGLEELQRVARLPRLPRRMECFDNSNIQGTDPVASMAVFVDGEPARDLYRRYRIKTVVGADDYASMAEILGRRLRRGLEEGDLPDLLVVDGGKGQLSAARAVLQELGVADQTDPSPRDRPLIPIIGIVKPRTERRRGDRETPDRLVLPGVKNAIRLPHNSAALRMVQHLRDETHNTAVRYHRKVRNRRTLASGLDGLPGVGPSRRKALLTHFGSAAAVRTASVEQLAEVPGFGPMLAERVYAALQAMGTE